MIRPDGLRVPDPGETFDLALVMQLDAKDAAELLNAAFSPLSFGPSKMTAKLMDYFRGALGGQAVFYEPEGWTIDAFYARPSRATLLDFLELELHLRLRKL